MFYSPNLLYAIALMPHRLYVTHPNVGQVRYRKYETGIKTDEGDLKHPVDDFRYVGTGSLDLHCTVATEVFWRKEGPFGNT